MTMLSSSSPVAATSRSGGRLIPARSSTNSSVASPRITWCSNSASSLSNRYGRCSISVTSWPPRSSERVEVRADLAAACDEDVHQTVACSEARTASASVSIAPRSGRRCAGRASRRTAARAGSSTRTTTIGTSKCFWAPGAITMFVLSPSVVTTTASASSIPASRSSVQIHAVADEEPAGPVVAESPERVLVLVDDGHVPARGVAAGARRTSRRGRSRSRSPSRRRSVAP